MDSREPEVAAEGKGLPRMSPKRPVSQVADWSAFRSLVVTLPTTKAKGDAFEALCSAFLRTDPRHAVRTISEIVNH